MMARTSQISSQEQYPRNSPPGAVPQEQSSKNSPPGIVLQKQSPRNSPPGTVLQQQSPRNSPPGTVLQEQGHFGAHDSVSRSDSLTSMAQIQWGINQCGYFGPLFMLEQILRIPVIFLFAHVLSDDFPKERAQTSDPITV